MTIAGSDPAIDALRAAGFAFAIPEYIGFGLSSGSPSEANRKATVDPAIRHLWDGRWARGSRSKPLFVIPARV